MKYYFFVICLLLSSLFVNCTSAWGQHTHTENVQHGITIDINKAFAEFDIAAAEQKMSDMKIPASEKAGYMRYLKSKHLQSKYPEYVYVNDQSFLEKAIIERQNNKHTTRSSYCTNAGFDMLDFTNWVGMYGSFGSVTATGIVTAGINASVYDLASRHTVLTTLPGNNNPALGPVVGFDELAINPLTGLAEIPLVTPQGSGVSVRLGNANIGSESERLSYTFVVTPDNANFYYHYAVVLEDPLGGHSPSQMPYFKVSVKDTVGTVIGGICGDYNVNTTLASTDTSFTYTLVDGTHLYYRNWEIAGVDLHAFIGQTITVEFETADCALAGHFGYAYIDADCASLLTTSFCSSDTLAALAGPPGYDVYQWLGPNSNDTIIGETNDTLFVSMPVIGDTFALQILSPTGCITTLESVLQHSNISVLATTSTNTCFGGSSGAVGIVLTGSTSSYNYLWSTGDTTQYVTGLPVGTYTIHVETDSLACGTIDTSITVISGAMTLLPLAADYCNELSSPIVAGAGSNYQWYDFSGTALSGEVNDTLWVNSPLNGMTFIVAYDGVGGCRDSIAYILNQLPLTGSFTVLLGPGLYDLTLIYSGAGSGVEYTVTDMGGFSYSSGITTSDTIVVTVPVNGSYTCSVTSASCADVILATITGIGNHDLNSTVHINAFPNPVSGDIWYDYSFIGKNQHALIELIDETGRVLIAQPVLQEKGYVHMNVSSMANGIYFYRVKVNGIAINGSGKIVVCH